MPSRSDRIDQTLLRIRLGVSGGRDLSFIPRWIEDFTSHPADPHRPWSFKDHEFQVDIAAAIAEEQASVMKISQAGVSELAIRMAAAYLIVKQPTQIIYTLQTSAFANKFCTTRIDPAIAGSPTIKGLLDPNVDNNTLKKLGSSFLHITGASAGMDPISIPATALFHDEVDFSDPDVLTTYQSRLGHQEEGMHHTVRFSTPTVQGFGISKFYSGSSKGRYAVKHYACSRWVTPEFFEDVVVPGFDDSLRFFERHHLEQHDLESDSISDFAGSGEAGPSHTNNRIRVNDAWLKCPHPGCGQPITRQNLADPEARAWVHEYPSRTHKGFKISSFDLPKINTPARTLRQLGDYKYKYQWVNHKVGETYEDAESSFLIDVVDRSTVLRLQDRAHWSGRPTVVGCDVGKVSWIVVGTRNGAFIDVIYIARIDTRDLHDPILGMEVLGVAQDFHSVMAVVDAAPDFTTAKHVTNNLPEGSAFGCYYEREGSERKQLIGHRIDLEKGLVHANRTAAFDDLSKDVNSGRIRFCECPEMPTVKRHLQNIKKVREDASAKGTWVDTGDTHFAHALNYLRIGFSILEEGSVSATAGLILPPITSVRIPSPRDDEPMGLADRPRRSYLG